MTQYYNPGYKMILPPGIDAPRYPGGEIVPGWLLLETQEEIDAAIEAINAPEPAPPDYTALLRELRPLLNKIFGWLTTNGYPIESVLLLNSWGKEPLSQQDFETGLALWHGNSTDNPNAVDLAQAVANSGVLSQAEIDALNAGLGAVGLAIDSATLEITAL